VRVPTDRRSRRGARIELEQCVELITSDGDAFTVKLKDLSRDGFKIQHDGADLVVGEIVTIQTIRSQARGQLQWVNDTDAGGAFIDFPAETSARTGKQDTSTREP
jgi:hypothetical protein